MVEFKLTIADPKTGKCLQKAVAEQAAKQFLGLKIGDSVKGDAIDMPGYEFMVTGGSDNCGFPMRKGINGDRKMILAEGGIGITSPGKGVRVRKTVAGETINEKTSQINLKVTKQGKKPLIEEKKEAKEEAKAEEKKPEEKPTEKKEESKKESPKEEKKEEPKEEEAKQKA